MWWPGERRGRRRRRSRVTLAPSEVSLLSEAEQREALERLAPAVVRSPLLTRVFDPGCRTCGGPVNCWGECLEAIWSYTYTCQGVKRLEEKAEAAAAAVGEQLAQGR